MDINLIHIQTLTDTLLDITGLPAKVLATDGTYKIFWMHVDDAEQLPYITIQPITGGSDSDFVKSEATDMVWEVVGVTANMTTAIEFAELIGKLHRKMPVTDNVPAVGYTYITWVMPIHRRKVTQNNPIFEVGGLYRLRLSLD